MSIIIKRFLTYTLFSIVFFSVNVEVFSQDIYAEIQLLDTEKNVVKIKGEIEKNSKILGRNWSFIKSYANASNLGDRVKKFEVFDDGGNLIKTKKLTGGEYLAEGKASSFSYEISLDMPQDKTLMAHISWMDKAQGMLMLGDLFPQFDDRDISAQVKLKIPQTWQVSTRVKKLSNNEFTTNNLEKTIFLIGKNWREKQVFVRDTKFNFVISGEWKFEDDVAFQIAQSILKEYAELFGNIPFKTTQVYLVRLPKELGFGRWRAETRGGNVVVLSSSMPFKSQAIQRLHEQLRHEIFHLWIPNSLNLSGDYAWFYEGFAVYQALKTGVWLGQIRFVDFLNTISQAYNLNNRVERQSSLIDISNNRWQTWSSSIYAKGILVAFLSDVAILKKSKGKRDLKQVFLEIYNKHSKNKPKQDANLSVLKVLESYPELSFIIEKHIKGSEEINWTNNLTSIGIQNVGNSSISELRLKKKLRRREKAILKKLGYNRWREILRKQK